MIMQQIQHHLGCKSSHLYLWLMDCSKWRRHVTGHLDIVETDDTQFLRHRDAPFPASYVHTGCDHVVVAENSRDSNIKQLWQRGPSSSDIFPMRGFIARRNYYPLVTRWHIGCSQCALIPQKSLP